MPPPPQPNLGGPQATNRDRSHPNVPPQPPLRGHSGLAPRGALITREGILGCKGGPHLLLGEVLITLRLLHPKFVVHLLAPLADVLPLAEVVDVCQPLLGLPLRFPQNILDFGVVLFKKPDNLGVTRLFWGSQGARRHPNMVAHDLQGPPSR